MKWKHYFYVWTDGRPDGQSDGQTNRQKNGESMTKLTVPFRNFVNSPEKAFPRYCYRHPQLTPRINSQPPRFLITHSSPVTSVCIKVLDCRTY